MRVKLLQSRLNSDQEPELTLRLDVDVKLLIKIIENNGREKATSIIGDILFIEMEKEINLDEYE